MDKTASLWSFSVAFYSKEGVKAQLLEWQNHYKLNVCVVLWLCWLHRCGKAIPIDLFITCINVAHKRECELLIPLRQVRKALTENPAYIGMLLGAVKKPILEAELEIERAILLYLESQALMDVTTLSDELVDEGLPLFKRYLKLRDISSPQPLLNSMAELLLLSKISPK